MSYAMRVSIAALVCAAPLLAGCPAPEPERNLAGIAGQLAADYARLDVDGESGLAWEEARAGAEMTAEDFARMDGDGNGALSIAEITLWVASAEGEAGEGDRKSVV